MIWILLCGLLAGRGLDAATWQEHALRLTGESEAVRQRAIRRLKKFPKLSEKLTTALGSESPFLALDVITTLKLRQFAPQVAAWANRDFTGAFYLALNTLMDDSNRLKLANLYRTRVMLSNRSVVGRVVMLDTLGRLRARLSEKELDQLAEDPSPEMRSSLLYYLRMLERKGEEGLRPRAVTFLSDPVYQIRAQAWWWISEWRGNRPVALVEKCQREAHGIVKGICQQVLRKAP